MKNNNYNDRYNEVYMSKLDQLIFRVTNLQITLNV